MLKNILVHIPSERKLRPVLDGSISLAVSYGAYLDAVCVCYENTSVNFAAEGGAAVAAVFEIEREQALERAEAALAVFNTEAQHAGVNHSSQAYAAMPAEASDIICAAARLHDLTVVLQPEPNLGTFDNSIAQEVLFQSGRPVLVLPYTHRGPCNPSRIGIAWDGSRLAARAVHDAMPFLRRAQLITIIAINEEKTAPVDGTSAMLAAHLARRGLETNIERLMADRGDIQPTLLSVAADESLDLLVMGGYGHSRLQERILGGVTRATFESMTLPTLMSH